MKFKSWTPKMEIHFNQRTKNHIERVAKNLERINDILHLDKKEIEKRKRNHDLSKYSKEEYPGYCCAVAKFEPKFNQEFTDEMDKKFQKAWRHHKKVNSHHPEFHKNMNDMYDLDLAEMIADWAAVSQEFNTSLKDWAEKALINKFNFNKENTEKIENMINIFKEVE